MLRRRSSPTPLVAGLIEHECPRCQRAVELPFGQLCGACRAEIKSRAKKTARIVAALSTLAVALYIFIPIPAGERARTIGLVGTVIWYVLSYMVVRRVMQNWER